MHIFSYSTCVYATTKTMVCQLAVFRGIVASHCWYKKLQKHFLVYFNLLGFITLKPQNLEIKIRNQRMIKLIVFWCLYKSEKNLHVLGSSLFIIIIIISFYPF